MTPPIARQSPSWNGAEPPNNEEALNFDSPDSSSTSSVTRRRIYEERECTVQEAMNEAEGNCASLLVDSLMREGHEIPDEINKATKAANKGNTVALKKIGDEFIDKVNECLSEITVTKDNAFETFTRLAVAMFSDGKINWGRIAVLMCTGCILAARVLFEGDLWKKIFSWILKFISERLLDWIVNNGGWDTCRNYLGSTSVQMIGVFLAGVALGGLIFWWKSKS